jgi:hypothetical protein
MAKQCACFAKGKEYKETQQAAASGPPKPINYTRRLPTPATTPYNYTPVNCCKVQMARGGVNSLFKILQASLNNHVSIKDG